MKRYIILIVILLLTTASTAFGMREGTRHITGSGLDVYFMNDKVFGTANGRPLWAIYNCGQNIRGEIDTGKGYRRFDFTYHRDGDRMITGTFGDERMGLDRIERENDTVVYTVLFGEREVRFSIRYEREDAGHLVNSIIEGKLPDGKAIRLTVDGRLCPFATTGIILITAGARQIAD